MEKQNKPTRSLWPYAIMGWFALALTGIVIFVSWAVAQKMDLERPDYYEQEIRYQSRIDSMQRTHALHGVRIDEDTKSRTLTVRLPATQAQAGVDGRVHFYRPSKASLDREVPLKLNADGTQRLNTGMLAPGLWKVRVEWRCAGQDFYLDQSLVIPPTGS